MSVTARYDYRSIIRDGWALRVPTGRPSISDNLHVPRMPSIEDVRPSVLHLDIRRRNCEPDIVQERYCECLIVDDLHRFIAESESNTSKLEPTAWLDPVVMFSPGLSTRGFRPCNIAAASDSAKEQGHQEGEHFRQHHSVLHAYRVRGCFQDQLRYLSGPVSGR
jgi:hypothetical protein